MPPRDKYGYTLWEVAKSTIIGAIPELLVLLALLFVTGLFAYHAGK